MTRPKPGPLEPGEVRRKALAVVAADRFPHLATVDGDQPRLRPVSPVRTEGFTVYVANLRGYHKTAEIAANPKVELCYLDDHHDQVRITGRAVPGQQTAAELGLRQAPELIDSAGQHHRNLITAGLVDAQSDILGHEVEPKSVVELPGQHLPGELVGGRLVRAARNVHHIQNGPWIKPGLGGEREGLAGDGDRSCR